MSPTSRDRSGIDRLFATLRRPNSDPQRRLEPPRSSTLSQRQTGEGAGLEEMSEERDGETQATAEMEVADRIDRPGSALMRTARQHRSGISDKRESTADGMNFIDPTGHCVRSFSPLGFVV